MCFPLATDTQSLPRIRRTAQESKEAGDSYISEFPCLIFMQFMVWWTVTSLWSSQPLASACEILHLHVPRCSLWLFYDRRENKCIFIPPFFFNTLLISHHPKHIIYDLSPLATIWSLSWGPILNLCSALQVKFDLPYVAFSFDVV